MNNKVDLKIFNPYQIDGLQRMGNKHDGGYVVHYPSLQSADCLINYGVGYNVSFEKKFNSLTHKPVYAFDPTMKKFSYITDEFKSGEFYTASKHILRLGMWLASEKSLHKHQIHFIEEGLSDHNSEQYKTLDYHLLKYDLTNKKKILKIDIEGAEYDVMKSDNFYEQLDNVVQLICEFHYVEKRFQELIGIMKRLERTHSLIHIHGNNNGIVFPYNGKNVPDAIEMAFLHNSFFSARKLSDKNYPLEGLDASCNWRRKDIVLDFFKQ